VWLRESKCGAYERVLIHNVPHTHEMVRVEPDLYRTLTLAPCTLATGLPVIRDSAQLNWLLDHRLSFFDHTRSLMVGYQLTEDTLRVLLGACGKLRDLYFEQPVFDWASLPFASCALTHLTCSFGAVGYGWGPALVHSTCTQTITHLCLGLPQDLDHKMRDWVAMLANLSHLALLFCAEEYHSPSQWLPFLPRLKCLVFMRRCDWKSTSALERELRTDARMLAGVITDWDFLAYDWQIGHAGKESLWEKADAELARRVNARLAVEITHGSDTRNM
jgi:hypothetical protein